MNVGTFLTKSARVHPERLALTDGTTWLDYRQFNHGAEKVATKLARVGLTPGDRVLLFMPNRLEYLVLLFGILKGGFVAVPVNAKLHWSEVQFIAAHCEARAVFFSEKSQDAAEKALTGKEGVHRFSVDSPSLDWLLQGDSPGPGFQDHDVDPDDPAWIFYTSGTTGRPKGATLTHRNLRVSAMNGLADICDFQPEDVVLHVAPLSHGSGLYALPSIARASANIIHTQGSFDADVVLDVVAECGVTVIAFLAPTMIHMLMASDRQPPDLLRRVVYGGAPIDPGLLTAAIERFGPVFSQIYGMGEAPMTITYLRPQDHTGAALTSAGIPRTDVEVTLLDEVGAPVPEGEEGEICVRGDVVMKGYWEDPTATERAIVNGWLHTGDVGKFESGFLYLLSRRDDVIISGGSNIYPREVEDILTRHPHVVEACVFGEPDDKWGESVVAVVVADQPVERNELLELCLEHIASFKKPKRIEFIDDLPKSAYGKVLRRELRQRFVSSR